MIRLRTCLLLAYLSFVLFVLLSAFVLPRVPRGETGTMRIVILLMLLAVNVYFTYLHAAKMGRKAVFYAIGAVLVPYIVPLVLYLLPVADSKQRANKLVSAGADVKNSRALARFEPTSDDARMLDSKFPMLKKTAYYLMLMKGKQAAGIASCVFGCITLIVCVSAETSAVIAFLGFFSLMLILEGVWLFTTDKTSWLIVDGLALMAIGTLNLLLTIGVAMTVAQSAESGQGLGVFIALGFMQFAYGWRLLARYKRYAGHTIGPLLRQKLRNKAGEGRCAVDILIEGILKTPSRGVPDLVEFATKNFYGGKNWKGRLSRRACVLVQESVKDIVFEKKEDVYLRRKGRATKKEHVVAVMTMGNRTYTCKVSEDNFKKLCEWRGQAFRD